MKKLSQWAKENEVTYHTAYNWYKTGKLPVKAYKNDGGSIVIGQASEIPLEVQPNFELPNIKPLSVSFASSDSSSNALSRRNRSSTITRTDQFINIEKGLMPFNNSQGYSGEYSSSVDVQEAIVLCQKAYYNFASFRNVIDLMTGFAISDITLTGGNDKSRKFFQALFDKIDLLDLQDRFYREHFRSGNTFIHRLDVNLENSDVAKLTQVYGAITNKIKLPSKYVILNPADIKSFGEVSYLSASYAKVLTLYEIKALANPKTEDDRLIFESLPQNVKDDIKNGKTYVVIPLDEEKIIAIFYKKQDYEPLSVPLGYPVLRDINWKEELKNIDMAISRTVQQCVLLITVGTELKTGNLHVNQKQIDAIQALFAQESVGRVLVSDFTTKASFVIPDIADILDPKKYQVVNEDIRMGLNNILVGEDKFANQQIKTKVFIQRLKNAQQTFKTQFLIPEIKRISQIMGFKTYPTPFFSSFELDDEVEWAKIYTRLGEIGIFTPEETIVAIDSGRLPTPEESLESQKKQKTYRDGELYMPLIGGQKKEEGKPPGTKTPKKKVTPIGASEITYSVAKLKQIAASAAELEDKVLQKIKKRFNKKNLTEEQTSIANQVSELIIFNESPENWIESIAKYIETPLDTNTEQVMSITELSNDKSIDPYAAALLYHSKK